MSIENNDEEKSAELESWDALCDQLREAGRRVMEAAPDDARDRAEGLRYLARLVAAFLGGVTADPAPARQVLVSRPMKVGLDNPDFVYYRASLDPNFRYVLRGELGDAQFLGIGAFSGNLGAKEGLVRDGYVETTQLEVDAEGGFELGISTEEQPGNWLAMGPATNALQVRQVLLERRHQRPARLELDKLGESPAPPALDPERFLRSLLGAGGLVAGTLGQFLGWSQHFQGHKHEVRPIPAELMAFAQGDPNTSYNYSYWELAEDEAFVIEFTPPACEYWNLQIGNHWLESLDFFHHDTHVNHHTAVADEEGRVRVIVARRDPGLPNWLDTAGHARGGLALRWAGADATPEPVCRVVSLQEISA